MLKVGEEQQEGEMRQHRRIQTQIREMWCRFKPRQKRGERTPEPGDE
jgi:hypothetical protein